MTTASTPLKGSGAQLWGYLEGEGEYYLGPGNQMGTVWGAGRAPIGLSDTITKSQFSHLSHAKPLNGRGKPLVQSNNGKHIPLIDVVATANKSVSAMMATAPPSLQATVWREWEASVKVGFEDMQQNAPVCRVTVKTPAMANADGRKTKTQGSTTKRVPGQLIGVVAKHSTARPTDETLERDAPPDPHMHIHVGLLNLAWVPLPDHPDGGKWYAVDDWGIKRHATHGEREAIIQGEFARRLENLGFKIDYHVDRKGRRTWELAGSTKEERWHFSSNTRRAEQVKDEFIAKHGRPPTNIEMREAMRVTRKAKDKEFEAAPNAEAWRADAERCGIKLSEVRPGQPIERKPYEVRKAELFERLYEPNGLTREDATFTRESIRPAVARCAVGLGFSPAELDELTFDLLGELVPIRVNSNDPRNDYFTTPRNTENELLLSAALAMKAATNSPAPCEEAIQWAIANQSVTLDEQQVGALRAACSTWSLTNIEGWAGAGKSTMLRAVLDAYRYCSKVHHKPLCTNGNQPPGERYIVVSTARKTAIETAEKIGADLGLSPEALIDLAAKGEWVTELVKNPRTGNYVEKKVHKPWAPNDRWIVIVEEAVMMDTASRLAVQNAVGAAQIIHVGDRRQIQAIGAGGWYEDQVSLHGLHTLDTVHRQRHEADRNALADIRLGRTKAAMTSFIERDRLHVSPTKAHRLGDVAAGYRESLVDGCSITDVRVVVDTNNADVDMLNRLIQKDLRASGYLDGRSVRLRSTDDSRVWDLHKGDRVIFLSAYWKPGQPSVRNGVEGTIISLDVANRIAEVETDGGEVVSVSLKSEDRTQPIAPSYALYGSKFQGGEALVTHVVPSRGCTSLEAGYSVTSRGIEEIHIYLDNETHGENPIDALADAWATPAPKRTAASRIAERDQQLAAEINALADRIERAAMGEQDASDSMVHCPTEDVDAYESVSEVDLELLTEAVSKPALGAFRAKPAADRWEAIPDKPAVGKLLGNVARTVGWRIAVFRDGEVVGWLVNDDPDETVVGEEVDARVLDDDEVRWLCAVVERQHSGVETRMLAVREWESNGKTERYYLKVGEWTDPVTAERIRRSEARGRKRRQKQGIQRSL